MELINSPRALSRIAGTLYLIIIALGIFDEMYVRSRIIAPGNAGATASNIQSMETLWRLGIAGHFFYLLCAVPLLLIFLVLLRPVSRELAWLAVFFNLISIAIEAVITMNLLTALFPLGEARYLAAFEPEQLQTLAMLAVRAHGHGFGVSLLFFGAECLVLGYLIARSGYLPKVIGILMALAGLAYLMNSFALFLSPALHSRLFPTILLFPFVGELSLCLWLLFKGVNLERWESSAGPQFTRKAAAAQN